MRIHLTNGGGEAQVTQLSQRDRAAGWELRGNVCCSF